MAQKKQQPLLLVSLPSSGSDWLAACLTEAYPWLVAHPTAKEFFNPICNPDHYDQLRDAGFGCELPSMYASIASPILNVDLALEAWRESMITFSKENYLGWKLELLSEHFDFIGLLRRAEHTFPPRRLRVLAWYDAIFESIKLNSGQTTSLSLATLHARAVRAHQLAAQQIVSSLDRPVLWWHDLATLNRNSLMEKIRSAIPAYLDGERLAREILTTRDGTIPILATDRNQSTP